jgi:cytochrome c556
MSGLSKRGAVISAILAASVFAGAAFAAELDDEDFIKARIAHFREIGTSFKGINDQAKTGHPDMAKVKELAGDLNALAKQQYTWFRPGSGPESEEQTKAKADIWKKPAEFKAAQDRLLAESNNMLAGASAGDAAGLPGRIKTLGAACQNCHQQFREDKD